MDEGGCKTAFVLFMTTPERKTAVFTLAVVYFLTIFDR